LTQGVICLVDGVAFGLSPFGGLIRYWTNLLPRLAPDLQVAFRMPDRLRAAVPTQLVNSQPDGAKLFVSTYYTTGPQGLASVAVVHDLIAEAFGPADDDVDSILERKRTCIAEAAILVVPSRATARRLRDWYDVRVPVAVIPHGVTEAFTARPHDAVDRRRMDLLVQSGVTRPYVLHVGGRADHKAFTDLLGAVCLDDELAGTVQVVAVGDETVASAQERSLVGNTDVLRLIGYVDDDLLASLYRGASAVVSASKMEGFGFTVVEAVACGSTVVCSAIDAHRETVAGFAEFFEPGDPDDLRRALTAALDIERVDEGRAQEFRWCYSWDEAARRFSTACIEAVQGSA
jgi:glycosyltransferase involved in cell wall biosynthesis